MGNATGHRVVILRAAAAEPLAIDDHERVLTADGRRDAAAVGRWIHAAGADVRLTWCSTAVRARETWQLAAVELPYRPRTVHDKRIYEASGGELAKMLGTLARDVPEVLLVGHDVGVHELLRKLTGDGGTGTELPAGGAAIVTLGGSWRHAADGTGLVTATWTPGR